jgi:predicted transcriptional regulator
MIANQDRPRVTEIVSSYVRHHQVPAEQLTAVIVEVHRALAGLGRAPPVRICGHARSSACRLSHPLAITNG